MRRISPATMESRRGQEQVVIVQSQSSKPFPGEAEPQDNSSASLASISCASPTTSPAACEPDPSNSSSSSSSERRRSDGAKLVATKDDNIPTKPSRGLADSVAPGKSFLSIHGCTISAQALSRHRLMTMMMMVRRSSRALSPRQQCRRRRRRVESRQSTVASRESSGLVGCAGCNRRAAEYNRGSLSCVAPGYIGVQVGEAAAAAAGATPCVSRQPDRCSTQLGATFGASRVAPPPPPLRLIDPSRAKWPLFVPRPRLQIWLGGRLASAQTASKSVGLLLCLQFAKLHKNSPRQRMIQPENGAPSPWAGPFFGGSI